MILAPKPRVPNHRQSAPSSPLARAPVLPTIPATMPASPTMEKSHWSDDSDDDGNTPTLLRLRRMGRRKQMPPKGLGLGLSLATVSEEDERRAKAANVKAVQAQAAQVQHELRLQEAMLMQSARAPAPASTPLSTSTPVPRPAAALSTSPKSRRSAMYSPGDDHEDPFALDLWESPEPVSTRVLPTTPSPRGAWRHARPPPLEIITDTSHPSLRYPVTPRLDGVQPVPTPTPAIAGHSAHSAHPKSSNASPTAARRQRSGTISDAYSPEPQTPLTPMAPPAALAIAAKAQAKAHAKDQDQLMDALRELLTSCGEYEVMHDDEDLFAHGSERPLVPRSASLPVEARDPRPPHSQRSHSIPHVAHVTRQATFAQPPVAAAPTHGPADAAPERTHERSRLFGHHAYLRSLSSETDRRVCPLDKASGSVESGHTASSSPTHLHKPLPVVESRQRVYDVQDRDDTESIVSAASAASVPDLTYASSSASASPVSPSASVGSTSDAEEAVPAPKVGKRLFNAMRGVKSAPKAKEKVKEPKEAAIFNPAAASATTLVNPPAASTTTLVNTKTVTSTMRYMQSKKFSSSMDSRLWGM